MTGRVFEARVEVAVPAVGELDDWLAESGMSEWMIVEDRAENRAWLVAYGVAREEVGEAGQKLTRAVRREWLLGDIELREIANANWAESYKEHFKPTQFGSLHWVPLWERESYGIPAGEQAVWLDPGLAFGTGNHETTRLCCERLVAFADARAGDLSRLRVVDAGCGSGILAISAAKLGFGQVVGFDNDPDAIRISVENAGLNACAERVRFFAADLESGFEGGAADFVMANILGSVLVAFAPQLVSAVAPGGLLVLSGILADEIEDVRRAFAGAAPGWSVDSRVLGEWADLALGRD